MYKIRLNNFFLKKTWLQAYFLWDMGVIWCNSLGDSHFQIYVMNNVEIVIDYYLHITSHVSHVVISCTYFTSYSLLNLVHEIVWIWFGHPRLYILRFWYKIRSLVENLRVKSVKILFLKFWVENKCFWKIFKLILMHFIHEILWIECFLNKTSVVFQKI